jgi:hypothetical protein
MIPLSSSESTVNSSGSQRSKVHSNNKPTIRKRHSKTKLQNMTSTASLSTMESSENYGISVVSPAPRNLPGPKRLFYPFKATGGNFSPVCVASSCQDRSTGSGKDTIFASSFESQSAGSACSSGDFPRFSLECSNLGISMPDNPLVARMMQRRRERQQSPAVDLPPCMPVKRQSVDCFGTVRAPNHDKTVSPGQNESFVDDAKSDGFVAGIVAGADKHGENSENSPWDHGFESSASAFTVRLAGETSLLGLETNHTASLPLKTISLRQDCHQPPAVLHDIYPALDVQPRQPRRLESKVSLKATPTTSSTGAGHRVAIPQMLPPAGGQHQHSVDSDTPLRQPIRVKTQVAMRQSLSHQQRHAKPDTPLRQPVRVNTQIVIADHLQSYACSPFRPR